jgi:hypothetical protein
MWLAGTRAPAHYGRDLGGIALRKMLPNLHKIPYDYRECRREAQQGRHRKALGLKKYLHQNKLKKKQDTIAGRTPVAAAKMATSSQHLIPGPMDEVIGLFHALQDHVLRPQDVTSPTKVASRA